MSASRRAIVFALSALLTACAGVPVELDPIIGRWRDVRHRHIYEFLPAGQGRFELFVPPDADPALSAAITPEVSWLRIGTEYEIILEAPGLDGGTIVQRNRARFEGEQLITDIRQRDGTLTLERVP